MIKIIYFSRIFSKIIKIYEALRMLVCVFLTTKYSMLFAKIIRTKIKKLEQRKISVLKKVVFIVFCFVSFYILLQMF